MLVNILDHKQMRKEPFLEMCEVNLRLRFWSEYLIPDHPLAHVLFVKIQSLYD